MAEWAMGRKWGVAPRRCGPAADADAQGGCGGERAIVHCLRSRDGMTRSPGRDAARDFDLGGWGRALGEGLNTSLNTSQVITLGVSINIVVREISTLGEGFNTQVITLSLPYRMAYVWRAWCFNIVVPGCRGDRLCPLGAPLDPRGSGLLFFMFIRPQPYTCLGIEWLTQGGAVYYFSCL